jgi:hypothetical protein
MQKFQAVQYPLTSAMAAIEDLIDPDEIKTKTEIEAFKNVCQKVYNFSPFSISTVNIYDFCEKYVQLAVYSVGQKNWDAEFSLVFQRNFVN